MPARSERQGPRSSTTVERGSDRAVVTLSPPVARAVRRMGEEMGGDVGPAEVVRRGLILLDLHLSLDDSEELVVRNKQTSDLERIRLAWDTF